MWIWIRSEVSLLHGVVGKGFGKSKRKSMVCVRIELSAMLYVRGLRFGGMASIGVASIGV